MLKVYRYALNLVAENSYKCKHTNTILPLIIIDGSWWPNSMPVLVLAMNITFTIAVIQFFQALLQIHELFRQDFLHLQKPL